MHPAGRCLLRAVAPALPKISYVLTSHNRSRYIREAVESALAQDYPGELEFIFSDDCSTDDTYDIICRCAADYTGPHRVITTRTPRNMGLAGNTNHAVSLATGEWVIRADDDDLAAVDRCSVIARAIAEHPGCTYVATGLRAFTDATADEARAASCTPCGTHASARVVSLSDGPISPLFPGANSLYSYKAWHISVYRTFGPLDEEAYYVDDLSCYYRANILGSGVYLDNVPAVLMRQGSGNQSRGGDDASRGYRAIVRLERFNDKYFNVTVPPLTRELAAYRTYSTTHPSPHLTDLLNAIEEDINTRKLLSTFWRRGILNRIRISRRLGYKGLFSAIRCLPLPVFAFVLALGRRLKR